MLQLRSCFSRLCCYYFCLKTGSVFWSFSGLYSLQDDEFNPCPRSPFRLRRIRACEQPKHLKITEYLGVVVVGDITSNELNQSLSNYKPISSCKQIWHLGCLGEGTFSSGRMDSIHEKSLSSVGLYGDIVYVLKCHTGICFLQMLLNA